MKTVTLHMTLRDKDADRLTEIAHRIIDDDGDTDQWTHVSIDLSGPGEGGTFTRIPACIESIGSDL